MTNPFDRARLPVDKCKKMWYLNDKEEKKEVEIMAEAMFAKAGRGYDRGQVDAFLLELNRTHAEKEAAWEDQKRELETALAEAKEALRKSEERCAEQEKTLRDALEAKERECETLQASIGQRMLSADARAEEILANAERRADDLQEKARRRAEAETARIIAETRAKCAVIGQAADVFAKRIGTISADLRRTENAINDAAEDLRRKALGNV